MSKASRLDRGTRLVPAAAPAGRALEKDPPAKTVLPMIDCDHTTPRSICTVGRTSAVTVFALRSCTGGGVLSAANAAGAFHTTATRARAAPMQAAINRRAAAPACRV